MKVFAWRLIPITPALNTVVAGGDSPVLDFHVVLGVRELALRIGPGAFVALELAADFELKPPGVLLVEEVAHVEQGDRVGGGKVGRGCRGRRAAQVGHSASLTRACRHGERHRDVWIHRERRQGIS